MAPIADPTALCVEEGSFKWGTKLTGTYTGGVYTYTNKRKKIDINVKVGTEERQLNYCNAAVFISTVALLSMKRSSTLMSRPLQIRLRAIIRCHGT